MIYAVGTKEGQNLFWVSAVIEGHLLKKVSLLSGPKIGENKEEKGGQVTYSSAFCLKNT